MNTENTVKITFAGDALCQLEMTAGTNKSYGALFDSVADDLKSADYAVSNLESPVAGEQLKYTFEKYCFNTPEEFLDALKSCGFSLITLANNHCMDRGEEGIVKTLENCRKYGFDTVGLYDSAEKRGTPFIKELGGIRVAFVNYTYGTNAFAHNRFLKNKYMVNLFQPEETLPGSVHLLNSAQEIEADVNAIYGSENEIYKTQAEPHLKQLESDIKNARAAADFVVMIAHCGGQYNAEVDPYTRLVMERICSCGVDIIIGHHPHIIQKSEFKNGIFTANSLGNFIFYPDEEKREIDPAYSALVNLYLKKAENGKVTFKIGFKILKVLLENSTLRVADTYALCREKNDGLLQSETVFYANRFAGKKLCADVQSEYFIDLQ